MRLWSTQIDEFLALVLASGLVDEAALSEACADLYVDRADPEAVDALCRYLIANDTLTEWQCDKLRKKKWKGFWLDEYCLLKQLGKGDMTSTYLAKERTTGKRVALVVTPPMVSPWVDGPIYRVEEVPDP
ncbi:MAG: hypothetical protein L0228_18825 [Planctomycetes bacterium]|nr:hypothetical protein [Planctomycetota bacterium]